MFTQQLGSPQLHRAIERYGEAGRRMAEARFWQRKAASRDLEVCRREYIVEMIRAAEALHLEDLSDA